MLGLLELDQVLPCDAAAEFPEAVVGEFRLFPGATDATSDELGRRLPDPLLELFFG